MGGGREGTGIKRFYGKSYTIVFLLLTGRGRGVNRMKEGGMDT